MHFPGLPLWVFPLGTPGSNTGFWSDLPSSWGSRLCLLSVLCVWSESESRSVVSNSLRHHGLYSPGNSPGQNTGVGEQPFQQRAKPEVNYELRSIITYQYWLINCTKCTILINGGTSGEEPACHAGDIGDSGLIPGSGRSPGGGHGNPLQYSCLENPIDRGAWQVTAHRVLKSGTGLKQLILHNTC